MEKVPVTRRNKKASVRKETDAVSVTKPKIVHKNQNTLPLHLLSQPYHEVEVCRGREVSEAKVTMVPLFDNRADIIREFPARERLVNSTAGDRCLFPHHKVDENPPKKKPKKGYYSHKRRESDDKNAVATLTSVSQLGCVSPDSDALGFLKEEKQPRGNPMQKVLGSNRKVRFTQSSLRQASMHMVSKRDLKPC